MADAAAPRKPEPKKPMGKPKKGPLEMAEFFYSRRGVNIWIFATSLLLTASCVLMIWQDWDREWKHYQLDFMEIELERARGGLEAARAELQKQEKALQAMEADLAAARKAQATATAPFEPTMLAALRADRDALRTDARKEDPAILSMVEGTFARVDRLVESLDPPRSLAAFEADLKAIEAVWFSAKQEFEFADADHKVRQYDVREAHLHLEEARASPTGNVSSAQKTYDRTEREFQRITIKVRFARRLYDWMEKLKGGLLTAAAELRAPAKKLDAAKGQLLKAIEDAKARIARFEMTMAKRIRNAPGLDFFGPPVKIEQIVIDDYLEDLNFVKVPKVDRCVTCHLGIDNVEFAASRDSSGKYRFDDPALQRIVENKYPIEEERQKAILMYMSHPRPELYALGTSPHPKEKFGCTSCHYGDGRETDFSLAVHTPESPEQEAAWKRRNHWHHRELWDRPMLPTSMIQASCRKCHSQEWEIEGADKYTRGMVLFERAGCYACHKTDAYPVLEKHLPKLAGGVPDESAQARRPGPPLTHLKDKVGKEWTHAWILSPRSFRPTTRMPHFFGQPNAREVQVLKPDGSSTRYAPREVEEVQAASIVEYLYSKSKTRNYDEPAAGLTGDSARGESLAKQVGCIACHKFEEDYPADLKGVHSFEEEFAPNLANGGRKFNRTWLFHWLKDPKHYMPQTNMPSLRLTDQEALDVAEYVLSLKASNEERRVRNLRTWEERKPPSGERAKELLDHLVLEQLEQVSGRIEAELRLRTELDTPQKRVEFLGGKLVASFGCFSCHEIDGWTDVEGIGTEFTGAEPWGNKFLDKLDFGQTKYDGVNYHGTRFQDGFTGRPYVSRVTGSTEIKIHHTKKEFLLHKVIEPRVYDGGLLASKHWSELLRMPNFEFSKEEAEAISVFVLSFTNEEIRGLVERVRKRMSETERSLNRGARIVRDANCLACHRMALDRFLVEWPLDPAGKKKTQVWLEGKRKARFGPEEAKELAGDLGIPPDRARELATYSWTSESRTLRMPEGTDSEWVAFDGKRHWYVRMGDETELLPVLRRRPVEGGTILPQIKALKEAQGITDEQALEARYPPMLRTQGSKTQAEWLYRFLKEPWPIRPNLAPIFDGAKTMPDVNLRMPTFGFTDEEATSLVKYFWARDTLPGREIYPATEFPMRDEAYVRRHVDRWTSEQVPFILKNCAECHYIDGRAPPGGPNDSYKFAPDLGKAHERLRPRWLEPWLEHPSWIYPGTTMTELYSDPKQRRDGVDTLLNWPRARPPAGTGAPE
jgi:mono/diheme cytochrome c family protein